MTDAFTPSAPPTPRVFLLDAPCELRCGIREFFPMQEWENAANVSYLESAWNAFAVRDTRDADHPCGSIVGQRLGVSLSAEYSIGYFQVNACNYPDWPAERFFNARHNVGTAHAIWVSQGWAAWYFSAQKLGLI
jgi:hypothetical protein